MTFFTENGSIQKRRLRRNFSVRGAWNKGNTVIPEPVWNAFPYYCLDENKPTVSLCYRSKIKWTKEFYPELLDLIPSEMTGWNIIESPDSQSTILALRHGIKKYGIYVDNGREFLTHDIGGKVHRSHGKKDEKVCA